MPNTPASPPPSPVPPPPPTLEDCALDPERALQTLFVDRVMGRRVAAGQCPVQRPVFLKPHGIAHGRFVVDPKLPDDLRIGVFAGRTYPVWARFSSDTIPTNPDLKTTCGIALKLFGVPGRKLLEPGATTHDFLLQNHDVFFVDTARDMCEFTHAGVVGGDYTPYLKDHPRTARILDDMAREVPSVATIDYWSVLPFAFGPDRHVKYKLEPILDPVPGFASPPSSSQPPPQNYLYLDLKDRLLRGEVAFRFLLQFQTDPESMPLDAATVRWSEHESHPIPVATLILPRQDLDASGQADYGENLAFNIWHALPDHRPAGSIAAVRKSVYAAAASWRRSRNDVPDREPRQPRPFSPPPPPGHETIVRAAIHPSIGIARLGNSPDAWFIGPEVPEPAPEPPGTWRDATGALKRQAARFRIYGYNAAGQVVAELNASNAAIDWCVHVANKKSAWYQFQLALDIPEAAQADPAQRRNAAFEGADRQQLVIDPGPRFIHGTLASGSYYRFDTGRFVGKTVYLGELRTDDAGRLLFLGGHGVSDSFDGAIATGFANSDGWHDDTSDGPVSATVLVHGRPIPCDPAWVVTAPPNYAPELKSVRTLHDLLHQVAVDNLAIKAPPADREVSFANEVLPILQRLCDLQWVNRGFAARFGWGAPFHFLQPDLLQRLATPPRRVGNRLRDDHREWRRQLFNAFRRPDTPSFRRADSLNGSPQPWPWVYGDAMNVPYTASPRQNTSLTDTQMKVLQAWAEGRFQDDLQSRRHAPRRLEDVPLQDQPAALDRASLDFCLADAFHPGCEVTWPIRHFSLFMAPFRIRHRPDDLPEPDYGPVLTAEIALAADGPLQAQGPGDLTRWMAVPWQTDTASCRSGYDAKYDPYVPTFWAARVPNQVLTEQDYRIVMDKARSLAEREDAFTTREAWLRDLDLHASYLDQVNRMVAVFGDLGVVERRPGPGDTAFPPLLYVESKADPAGAAISSTPSSTTRAATARSRRAAASRPEPHTGAFAEVIDKVRRLRHPPSESPPASTP